MHYFIHCVQRAFACRGVWIAAFIGVLTFSAVPAKAQGFPSSPECTCHGANNWSRSGNSCINGAQVRPLCSPSSGSGVSRQSPLSHIALGTVVGDVDSIAAIGSLFGNFGPADNDPFASYTRYRRNDISVSSGAGNFAGFSVSGRTNVTSLGTDAYYNASKTFQLAGSQRLVVGGYFRYDSLHSNVTGGSLIPNVVNVASAKTDLYNLGGTVSYFRDTAYAHAGLSGSWGRTDFIDGGTGGTATSPSKGWVAAGQVGNIFTLYDTRVVRPAYVSKAPPRPVGGYALQLDVNGYAGWAKHSTSGFIDTTGLQLGENAVSFWNLGTSARLFATIPSGRLTWQPSVALSLDQQVNYSHTLIVPGQPGIATDTIHYGTEQTFLGVRAGVSAHDISGFIVGAYGFYKQSSDYDIVGVHGYIRYRFPE